MRLWAFTASKGLFVSGCWAFSNMLAAEGGITTSGVPAGFEEFLEPQTTAVDIFYGEAFLLTTLATYTPESIQFESPEEISAQLHNVIDPVYILALLQAPLAPNTELICYDAQQEDCGAIKPDDLAVIFDDGRFRVDVFIHPNLLTVQDSLGSKYLPPSTTDFSYLTNFSGTLSGGQDGNQFNLQGVSLFSQQEQRLNATWNIDDEDGLALSRLFWQKDEEDFQYQAGWFNGNNRYLDFIGSTELMGFSYSTSLNTRTDLDSARGTPLQIFLSSRSRVSLLKDGRIVSSAFYDAGNQILNTSDLPEGAYDVEIQVTDLSGRVETLRRFYAKTPRIPPEGQDLYFIEAGGITRIGRDTTFPENEGEFTIRGGYSHRIRDEFGLDVASAFAASELVAEAGLYYLQPNYSVQPKMMLSTQGDFGLSLIAFGRYKKFSGSYSLRNIWSDNHRDTSGDFHLINSSASSHSFSLNYPINKGQLSFNTSLDKRGDESAQNTYSLSYDRGLYKNLNSQLDLTTEYSSNDDDTLFFIRVSWRKSRDRVTHTAYSSVRVEDNTQRDSSYLRAGYNASWNDGERYPNDILARVDVNADRFEQRLGGEVSYLADIGRARLAVEHQVDASNNTSSTSYVSNFSSSVAGEHDAFGWGGKEASQSGVLLDIVGDVQGVYFDIIVNGRKHGQTKSGKVVFIPLSPYETYDIQLKDRGIEFIAFDDKPKQVTLYPGNVELFEWSADKLKVVIGRLVRRIPGCNLEQEESDNTGFASDLEKECWVPMINARLEGAYGWATTDSDGFFQAEVKERTNQMVAKRKDYSCTINLPSYTGDDGLVYLEEDLRCHGAPEPEVETPEVACGRNAISSSISPDAYTRVIQIDTGCDAKGVKR